MRDLFPGHYAASDAEVERVWREGLIVLDTNVLLNLWRYSYNAREEFLGLLTDVRDRLWLPYQVAAEYQRDRHDVIQKVRQAYQEARTRIQDVRSAFDTIARDRPAEWLKQVGRPLKKLESLLVESEKQQPHLGANYSPLKDEIHEELAELLEGQVGPESDSDEMKAIADEGRQRYAAKVPPGYKDDDKPERQKYGDLVLWKQVLSYAATRSSDVLFVTDDEKEDWWWQFQGKTLGPRPELRAEFHRVTKKSFLSYKAAGFMSLAGRYLSREVSEEVIGEAEKVGEDFFKTYYEYLSQPGQTMTFYPVTYPPPKVSREAVSDVLNAVRQLREVDPATLRAIDQAVDLEQYAKHNAWTTIFPSSPGTFNMTTYAPTTGDVSVMNVGGSNAETAKPPDEQQVKARDDEDGEPESTSPEA